jgi:hypothetical protein
MASEEWLDAEGVDSYRTRDGSYPACPNIARAMQLSRTDERGEYVEPLAYIFRRSLTLVRSTY